MRAAGRDICDGFEIGVDVDQLLEHGARYRDKRPVAQKMWTTMMDALRAASCDGRRSVGLWVSGCECSAPYVLAASARSTFLTEESRVGTATVSGTGRSAPAPKVGSSGR